MSISASLQASARAAYRDLLRAASLTFQGDDVVRNGEHGTAIIVIRNLTRHWYSLPHQDAQRNNTERVGSGPQSV